MNLSKVTAGDISDDAIALDVSNNILDARNVMMKYNISRAIITDNKMLVGMVTEKDIIRFVYSFNSSRSAHEIRLGQVMGNKAPITVEDSMSLTSCAKLMLNKGISSLIVTHKNSTDVGIITKTDIVDYYSKFYKRLNKVRDYMTTSVFSISPDELVIEAIRLLLENKVARIVVIKNDKAIGIITGRDLLPLTSLVSSGFEKYDKKNQFGSNIAMSSLKGILFVGDIMRSSLITILGTEDLAVAAKIMIRNRISGLPVVDKNDKLKGIVTKTDILRAFSKIL
ncbi:MAG TPA: CBS domain-containing protein [Nitrososphaeraceae archaeon]|jgi:CBS domain-containing protein|nr:CBS domain-containing protein [Nitrososphaeraceae archaeon]